jgi:hypothetical protein
MLGTASSNACGLVIFVYLQIYIYIYTYLYLSMGPELLEKGKWVDGMPPTWRHDSVQDKTPRFRCLW